MSTSFFFVPKSQRLCLRQFRDFYLNNIKRQTIKIIKNFVILIFSPSTFCSVIHIKKRIIYYLCMWLRQNQRFQIMLTSPSLFCQVNAIFQVKRNSVIQRSDSILSRLWIRLFLSHRNHLRFIYPSVERLEITAKREAEKTFPIMEARNRAIARFPRHHVARRQPQLHWKLISA